MTLTLYVILVRLPGLSQGWCAFLPRLTKTAGKFPVCLSLPQKITTCFKKLNLRASCCHDELSTFERFNFDSIWLTACISVVFLSIFVSSVWSFC